MLSADHLPPFSSHLFGGFVFIKPTDLSKKDKVRPEHIPDPYIPKYGGGKDMPEAVLAMFDELENDLYGQVCEFLDSQETKDAQMIVGILVPGDQDGSLLAERMAQAAMIVYRASMIY